MFGKISEGCDHIVMIVCYVVRRFFGVVGYRGREGFFELDNRECVDNGIEYIRLIAFVVCNYSEGEYLHRDSESFVDDLVS